MASIISTLTLPEPGHSPGSDTHARQRRCRRPARRWPRSLSAARARPAARPRAPDGCRPLPAPRPTQRCISLEQSLHTQAAGMYVFRSSPARRPPAACTMLPVLLHSAPVRGCPSEHSSAPSCPLARLDRKPAWSPTSTPPAPGRQKSNPDACTALCVSIHSHCADLSPTF